MDRTSNFQNFLNVFAIFFFNIFVFSKKLKIKKRHAVLLVIFLLSCISTKNIKINGESLERDEKFGVQDSILKIIPAPYFSSLEKKNSSVMEEELVGLSYNMPDVFLQQKLDAMPGFDLNGFYPPTEGFTLTDSFNVLRYKWKKKKNGDYLLVSYRHSGLDFRVKIVEYRNGREHVRISDIFSVENGKVAKVVKNHPEYGNYIDIIHTKDGCEYYSRYAHLDIVYVKKGQMIEKSGRIAKGGNTGRSRGAHLHFEVFVIENGKRERYNPLLYFSDFQGKGDIVYRIPRKRTIPKKPEAKIAGIPANDTISIILASVLASVPSVLSAQRMEF